MDSTRLKRLLRPRSIAAIGGGEAEQVVRQCQKMEFAGEVWPVHPGKNEVLGIPCYRSVGDLPGAPDAVFLGVNRHVTNQLVPALRTIDAGGAVCYASGYNESGAEGDALASELIEAAGDMPVIGPNCYGLINYLDGALLWPDQHGGRRCANGVAILVQSSNIAINLTMQRRGLPLAYIVALGNQLCVGMSEMIETLVEDERVTAIGLHIEGFDDVVRFDRALGCARALNKPVVALKAGRSQASQSLTLSHTASVAGGDAPCSALLDRLGVGEVRSIPVFLDALKLLHCRGPLASRDIISLSCSGGEASLISDAAENHRVRFKPFTPEQEQRIRKTVNPLVSVSNPLDYHTFDWGNEERLGETFSEALSCGFSAAVVIFDVPREDRCDATTWLPTLNAFARAAGRVNTVGILLSTLPENLPEHWIEACGDKNLVGMWTLDDALAAIEVAADIGEVWSQPTREPVMAPVGPAGTGAVLSEHRAKYLLQSFGIPVPRSVLCRNRDEADQAAAEIGFPVALKAAGAGILHKTEQGGVYLDIRDNARMEAAAKRLFEISDQVLVESMIGDGVAELLIGVARDPVIGLYFVVGTGGVEVEWLNDVRVLTLPLLESDVWRALKSLRGHELLNGHRGRPAADIDAVVAAALCVGAFAREHGEQLTELDINPLIVRPDGHGCVAADALLVM
ncbi:MAG: Protein lysine acetyltransferase Pka [Gammaproteobacteria bacterium]|nr:Protein lysine acetyltransferase Pka [Gammaproteobacteria bacterium]